MRLVKYLSLVALEIGLGTAVLCVSQSWEALVVAGLNFFSGGMWLGMLPAEMRKWEDENNAD